jgi:hypothetical protein
MTFFSGHYNKIGINVQAYATVIVASCTLALCAQAKHETYLHMTERIFFARS